MPYLGRGEAANVDPPSAASMAVDPEKILQLKKRLEDRRTILSEYLWRKGKAAFTGRAPGSDPCSDGCAAGLTENGTTAATATHGFVSALTETIKGLHKTLTTKGLRRAE